MTPMYAGVGGAASAHAGSLGIDKPITGRLPPSATIIGAPPVSPNLSSSRSPRTHEGSPTPTPDKDTDLPGGVVGAIVGVSVADVAMTGVVAALLWRQQA